MRYRAATAAVGAATRRVHEMSYRSTAGDRLRATELEDGSLLVYDPIDPPEETGRWIHGRAVRNRR